MLVMADGVFSVLAYLGSQKNTIMMSDNIDNINIVILEHNLRTVPVLTIGCGTILKTKVIPVCKIVPKGSPYNKTSKAAVIHPSSVLGSVDRRRKKVL